MEQIAENLPQRMCEALEVFMEQKSISIIDDDLDLYDLDARERIIRRMAMEMAFCLLELLPDACENQNLFQIFSSALDEKYKSLPKATKGGATFQGVYETVLAEAVLYFKQRGFHLKAEPVFLKPIVAIAEQIRESLSKQRLLDSRGSRSCGH